jgi:hypothetical protein
MRASLPSTLAATSGSLELFKPRHPTFAGLKNSMLVKF